MSRLLLIDDDELFLEMLRRRLIKMGYDVLVALNGAEGAKLFQKAAPDLVVTDLIMPEREGLETIQYLRRLKPDVKIIAISGGMRINARDFLQVARKFGAQAALEKPFTCEHLATLIESVLDKTNG